MKRIAIEPTTVLHPHPVLLVGTFGADGKPNLMNAALGGICYSDPPCVAVSLREATLTYHNILHTEAFTVGIPSRNHVEAADYVGIVSGRDHDKFRDTGLTPVKSEKVNAPLAAELPFSLRRLDDRVAKGRCLFAQPTPIGAMILRAAPARQCIGLLSDGY
jgi:flavin reductase (DIM6/NTAB) family NADH-FMN oxidoreductase RutF